MATSAAAAPGLLQQVGMAGGAAVITVTFIHPIDVVKVRLIVCLFLSNMHLVEPAQVEMLLRECLGRKSENVANDQPRSLAQSCHQVICGSNADSNCWNGNCDTDIQRRGTNDMRAASFCFHVSRLAFGEVEVQYAVPH